jgi:hypothetical protein
MIQGTTIQILGRSYLVLAVNGLEVQLRDETTGRNIKVRVTQ